MLNKDIIFEKYDLKPDTILIPKRGIRKAATIEQVIDALYKFDKEAAKHLGLSVQILRKYIKIIFPEINLLGLRNRSWEGWFLEHTDYKRCSKCKDIHVRSNFSKDKITPDGLKHECKSCIKNRTNTNEHKFKTSIYNKFRYEQDIKLNREYRKNYYNNHKNEYKRNNAKRRAIKLNATPSWADLNKISDIYNNCPTGYEVDHIIPLQGENVCGLHIENNLQYLTTSDNRSKSNKFTQEGAS